MKTCWCSLAGTKACLRCPDSVDSNQVHTTFIPFTEGFPPFQTPIVFPVEQPKKKTTIETFDKDGKLIERKIIEE